MRFNIILLMLLIGGTFPINAWAQPAQNPQEGMYVSREEYNQLKRDFEALKSQITQVNKRANSAEETQEYLQYLDEEMSKVKQLAELSRPGTTNFLISGYTDMSFTDRQGEGSTFSATFNPIFLWKLNERLFFEGELEVELASGGDHGGETETNLEYANLSYLLSDNITVGAGKFLTPFGIFNERLHPSWINKLPDAPLPYLHDGGLAPTTSLGAFVRGGYPIGDSMKGNYAFYLSNGPTIVADEEHEVGMLGFDNYEDVDYNKAVGGRVGILPVTGLEVGYSFQVSRTRPEGLDRLDVLLMATDLSYICESDELGGALDFRFEYVWSDVDDTVYDPSGADFGPVTFDNNRSGWYSQIAYRPTKNESDFIKNLEMVFRYDEMDNPEDAPESFDQQRYTFGLNYWLGPSTVLKAAYQIDDKDGDGVDADAVLIQAAMGF